MVFSPVRYLSQVSDSSILHPVRLSPDHGLGRALYSHTGRYAQAEIFLPWSSKATCPWRPAITPALGPTTPAPAMGNHRPSAPTPMPLIGTAAPGTGPGAGPGAWSGDSAVAAGPDQGTGHSFLWPPPAAAFEPRWASCIPIALPVTARRPRPGATAVAAWPAVGNRCPSALDPTPAPRVDVPLFRPLEANPGMGLLPPRYQYAPSGNFFKKSLPINPEKFLHPLGDRTRRRKNLKRVFGRGIRRSG